MFHVNQIMQFGRFVAVFQKHPADADKTVVSAFVVLGVESDPLEKKKEYEQVPVLRNLVPAQVLSGNSSFNTGNSRSARGCTALCAQPRQGDCRAFWKTIAAIRR